VLFSRLTKGGNWPTVQTNIISRAFQRGMKPIGVSVQVKKNIPTHCAMETWNLVFHTTDININSSLKQRKEKQFGLILHLSFPLLKQKMGLSKEKSKT